MTKAALKSQNTGWIWTVVVADALTLAGFAFPSVADQAASWMASGSRLVGASIAPVVVLLLTSLMPAELKAVMVFWRVRDVLPGHRAFSFYAPTDPRVDLQRLRSAVGQFPELPRDQNTLWYRLLKKVEGDAAVSQAHRYFLLFRDLSAISLFLGVFAPLVLYFLGASPEAAWLAVALFGFQYAATAVAARFHGVRLVCNVLALHGAADTSKPKRARAAARRGNP